MVLTKERAEGLDVQVGRVFRPARPVDEQSLFAGRRNELRQVLDAVNLPGQHVLIFGDRGVGKTSLARILSTRLTPNTSAVGLIAPHVNCDTNDDFSSVWRKVFSKVTEQHEKHLPGFGDQTTSEETITLDERLPDKVTTEDVRRELARLSKGNIVLTIIDEFDRLKTSHGRAMFSDAIKTLSDHDVRATVVLVGVADTVDALIEQHHSVGRALTQVRIPRMTVAELKEVVLKGLQHLTMTIADEAISRIALLSQGLPYYVHLLSLWSCREALDELSEHITADHLDRGLGKALTQVQQSLKSAYQKATNSPRKQTLYPQVLLACALAEGDDSHEQGSFTAGAVREPLRDITQRDLDIPSFARHLKELSGKNRGEVLRRLGEKHRIRFRFQDPLMQPYVIMRAMVDGTLLPQLLEEISVRKISKLN